MKEPIMRSAIARELDERLVELQSLFEMSQVLNSSLQLRTTLNNLLLTPMGRMMISRGVVLVSNDQHSYEVAAMKGLPRQLAGKKILCGEEPNAAIMTGELTEANEVLRLFFEEHEIELIIPIVSAQRTVGLMGLGPRLGGVAYSAAEIEYLTSLSNIASSAIENALMFQDLERLNRRLDKKVQELRTLFEIGKELNATLDKERIVNLLIYAVMGELVVGRCFVYLHQAEQLTLFASRGLRVDDRSLQELSAPPLLEALVGVTQAVNFDNDEVGPGLERMQQQQIKLLIPMQIQEEVRGFLAVGEKITSQPFQAEEVEFLSTLCNLAIISVENARLFEETLEKERIEEELNIAREIQQRLLPHRCPRIDSIEIHGLNIPTRQVGGDYFDCIRLDEDHLAIAIADVSGKGVPASLLMSSLHAGLRNLVTPNGDIRQMVSRLNNFIQANTNYDKFITFFYGEFDLRRHTFAYVNAGHNYPYLFRADGSIYRLQTGGLLLGMMPDVPYESESLDLRPGDLLLLFTDGVTEAKNVEDEDFEEERLEALVWPALQLPVQHLLESIVEAIRDYCTGMPQSDDITMMAARWLR